jgi:hypothetical protein
MAQGPVAEAGPRTFDGGTVPSQFHVTFTCSSAAQDAFGLESALGPWPSVPGRAALVMASVSLLRKERNAFRIEYV